MIVIVPDEIVLANVVTDIFHHTVLTKLVGEKMLTRDNYIALAALTSRLGSAYVSYQELENGITQHQAYMQDISVVKHSLRELNIPNLLDYKVVKRLIIDFLEKIGATQMQLHIIIHGVQRSEIRYWIDKESADALSPDDKMLLVSLLTNQGV